MARCPRALQAEIRRCRVTLSVMRTIEMSEAGSCFMAFKDYFGFAGWAGEGSVQGREAGERRLERARGGPRSSGRGARRWR